jgi:MFS family permease
MLLKSYPSKLLSHDAELRIILCLALVAVLGVSSIAPVLPHLMDVFHITKQKVAWLITIFTLPGIFFSLFFGVLVDRLGCKKILIPSLTLFAVSGLLCAFTTQFSILLALRFIQGSTATAIGVINLTLITHLYEGKKKTAVMGAQRKCIKHRHGDLSAFRRRARTHQLAFAFHAGDLCLLCHALCAKTFKAKACCA